MNVLRWAGVVLLSCLGLPLVAMGLVGVGDPTGQTFLCLGAVAVVGAVAGAARLVAERRDPPPAQLVELAPGEPALFLPRSPLPSRIASGALLGLASVAAAAAVFAGLTGAYAGAAVLAVVAVALGLVGAPGRDLAGGLWFSARRLVHEHDGLRWEAPWDDVTGVVPEQPMPVLVRPDRQPTVTRTGPPGRGWRRSGDGVLAVDTRFLAGGSALASYVIAKAVTEPASRDVLGTPESLPPRLPG